jgi:hypothetical protein
MLHLYCSHAGVAGCKDRRSGTLGESCRSHRLCYYSTSRLHVAALVCIQYTAPIMQTLL